MIDTPSIGLRIVSGDEVEPRLREHLRPGASLADEAGVPRVLPAHYYEVPSWEAALETQLAPNFGLWEMIDVDLREQKLMRMYPRYVPCAITLLATALQMVRNEVGRVMRIAANGGYRSPAHRMSRFATPHAWGTAANVYRIGDDWMDSRERIERYVEVARRTLPGAWVRPYGERPGYAFDHLHIDLGFFAVEPHAASHTGG